MAADNKPTFDSLARRYTYHSPKEGQLNRYAKVRAAILKAALDCVEITPISREQERALEALDKAMFLFNESIARNE